MVTSVELACRGLPYAVMVDYSIALVGGVPTATINTNLQDLKQKGLPYRAKVADGVVKANCAALERCGLRYFVPVLVDATPASKASLAAQGLAYAVQVSADILPADRLALDRQGFRYFVEVDSSGNSIGAGPINTVAPVVSGSLMTGSILSCTTGTWSNSPSGYAYQWKRGVADISGATASTYTLVEGDIGAMVSCAVTATNASGSATAASNAVGPIVSALATLFGADDGFYPVKAGYVFTDTAGTVAATVDGDLIACFKPQYGGLPNVVQATSTARPLLKIAGPVWYALGDGGDTWLSAATVTTSTEQLLAVALRRAAERAGEQLRAGAGATSKHSIDAVSSGSRMQGVFRFAAGTIYTATPAGGYPINTDLVASSKLTATTVDVAVDQGTPTSAAAVAAAISSAAVGCPTTTMNVDRVYGWALYQGTVGTVERTAIVSALGALQGRTI